MLKVLHICYGTEAGGITSVILNYYSKIDHSQFHFDIATNSFEKGNAYDDFVNNGIKVLYVGTKSNGLKEYGNRLKEILLKGNYDVVHAHTSFTSWYDMVVAWKCGIKGRIVHGHNAIREKENFKSKFKREVSHLFLRLFCTKRIACGKDAAKYIFGSCSKNIFILPNAIDTGKFRFNNQYRIQYRNTFKIKSDELLFGTVGRMYEEKNQTRLIGIIQEIVKQNAKIKLILVGDGEDYIKIRSSVQKNHLEKNVIMTGSRKDVDKLLNAFDLFVLPSHYEGFPISAIEALTNGLPVLLSSTITKELEIFDEVEYFDLG
ncbi:MAG: glycosyltransferase, partial [Bacilli bacterium]|nr:glycosyltransferase [Bacilli bacterium]